MGEAGGGNGDFFTVNKWGDGVMETPGWRWGAGLSDGPSETAWRPGASPGLLSPAGLWTGVGEVGRME